jgi:hypothetical protein
MTEVTNTAPAKPKSPILSKLEKIVYERCVSTGETAENALADDSTLHSRICTEACAAVKMEKVQRKLEENASWWKTREANKAKYPERFGA